MDFVLDRKKIVLTEKIGENCLKKIDKITQKIIYEKWKIVGQ